MIGNQQEVSLPGAAACNSTTIEVVDMQPIVTINKERMAEQGKEIYQRIKDQLEPKYKGKIVAIEVESGDDFLGENTIEVSTKAKKKHPDKVFYFVKVGYRAVSNHHW